MKQIFWLFILILLPTSNFTEIRKFKTIADGNTKNFEYFFSETPEGENLRHITLNDGEKISSLIDKSGNFISQTIEGPKRNLKQWISGKFIYVEGKINGKEVKNHFDLEGKPYFGDGFSLAFRFFVQDHQQVMNFKILDMRTENVSMVEMYITKKENTLYREKPAIRVEIKIAGLLSLFWWGDFTLAADGRTIYKYEGNQGIGTPQELTTFEGLR